MVNVVKVCSAVINGINVRYYTCPKCDKYICDDKEKIQDIWKKHEKQCQFVKVNGKVEALLSCQSNDLVCTEPLLEAFPQRYTSLTKFFSEFRYFD